MGRVLANFELSLNGSWKFKGFDEGKGEELGAQRLEYDEGDWLSAKVPRAIFHIDLLDNKLIPDPFKGCNEREVQWVNENEWWYRKEIDLTDELVGMDVVELFRWT